MFALHILQVFLKGTWCAVRSAILVIWYYANLTNSSCLKLMCKNNYVLSYWFNCIRDRSNSSIKWILFSFPRNEMAINVNIKLCLLLYNDMSFLFTRSFKYEMQVLLNLIMKQYIAGTKKRHTVLLYGFSLIYFFFIIKSVMKRRNQN